MIDFDGSENFDWTDTVEVTITYTTHLPRALVEAYNTPSQVDTEEMGFEPSEVIDAIVGELVHMTSPEVTTSGR